MKKTRGLLFSCAVLLISMSTRGQLSLTNPRICHDENNYLRCYNDGTSILNFDKGNFKEYRTSDNSIIYSDSSRRITFLHTRWIDMDTVIDTIEIIQLPRSILLRTGKKSMNITSLDDITDTISDFGIGTYSGSGIGGLNFWVGKRFVELKIEDWRKTWSWTMIVSEGDRVLAIDYNGFKKNRLQYIFIEDHGLRYGMGVSTTFKTLKKTSQLMAMYVDTIGQKNGHAIIGQIPLEKNYRYEYNKAGKLRTEQTVGEIKLCDCNLTD